MTVSKTEENTSSNPTDIALHIPVLHIIKEAQQQHGLRHEDYQRYYQYVARKIRRMRKALHFIQGNRSKVTPKKITPEMVTDSRFIMLKVFEIERSWAFAMQLSSEANTEPRKRFHMMSRLQKASKRADELSVLASKINCNAQTKLELQSYIMWIQGIKYFERKNWMLAVKRLENARAIYAVLQTSVDQDVQTVYAARVAEILPRLRYCAHNIAEEGGDVSHILKSTDSGSNMLSAPTFGGLPQHEMDQLLSQVMTSQAQAVTEVTWLGETIPVKVEAARLAIAAVHEAETKKDEGSLSERLTVYDGVLKHCVEAIGAVRDELQALNDAQAAATSAATTGTEATKQRQGRGPNTQMKQLDISKLPRTRLLHSYLQYLKLSTTISRNLIHVETSIQIASNTAKSPSAATGDKNEKSSGGASVSSIVASSQYSKPQELARLYDTLVQTLQEIVSLHSIPQEEGHPIADLLKAKIAAYKSFRCYYLALAYQQGRKFTETQALLARAEKRAQEATESLSALKTSGKANDSAATEAALLVPGPSAQVLITQLAGLVRQCEAEVLVCKAGRMLDTVAAYTGRAQAGALAGKEETEKQMAERLQRLMINELNTYPSEQEVEKRLLSIASGSLTSGAAHLTAWPPTFKAVPVKPVFFDLALNHIGFPAKISATSNAQEGSGGEGLTGMVKGWLWGSGGANV